MAGAVADSKLTILCVGCNSRPAARINRLYRMVTRRAGRPMRFFCLRSDTDGIDREINCLTPPKFPLTSASSADWTLLGTFAPSIAAELGDCALILSPDVLVLGQLDPFFERPGDFIMIRDWYHPWSGIGNDAVVRFRPPRLIDAFEQYCSDPQAVTSRFRNAREYLSWYAGYFGALSFWPNGWCASFRHDCVPPWPLNHWRAPRPPAASRIVVFHGEPVLERATHGGPATAHTRMHLPAPWIENGARN